MTCRCGAPALPAYGRCLACLEERDRRAVLGGRGPLLPAADPRPDPRPQCDHVQAAMAAHVMAGGRQ